jgi:hypothetical protein
MVLSAKTACNVVEIWQPRWKDRTVLIAKYKVGSHNIVRFTKAKSLSDDYYLSGNKIKNFPINNNGKVDCYVVPLDELEILERQ